MAGKCLENTHTHAHMHAHMHALTHLKWSTSWFYRAEHFDTCIICVSSSIKIPFCLTFTHMVFDLRVLSYSFVLTHSPNFQSVIYHKLKVSVKKIKTLNMLWCKIFSSYQVIFLTDNTLKKKIMAFEPCRSWEFQQTKSANVWKCTIWPIENLRFYFFLPFIKT